MENINTLTLTNSQSPPNYVYVSIKQNKMIDAIFQDENIAMLTKCKECIIQKWIVNESKFITL